MTLEKKFTGRENRHKKLGFGIVGSLLPFSFISSTIGGVAITNETTSSIFFATEQLKSKHVVKNYFYNERHFIKSIAIHRCFAFGFRTHGRWQSAATSSAFCRCFRSGKHKLSVEFSIATPVYH